MKILLKVSVVMLSLMMKECVTFEEVALTDDSPKEVAESEKGIPVLAYNAGDLLNAGEWWGGAGDIAVSKSAGIMKIKAKGIGPKYTPVGLTLPGIDFSKDAKTGESLILRVVARSMSSDGSTPMLSLQFDDFMGMQTNAARPSNRIHLGGDFETYCYDLKDIWMQSWPEDHDVNKEVISKMMLFINPGGAGYTGEVFIKEAQVIKASAGCESHVTKLAVGKDGGMIADFNEGIGEWWSSDKIVISQEDSALKIEASGAGPNYECVGTGFSPINFLNANKIRVKARIVGENPPELRIDLKDPDGYTTNSRPSSSRIYPTENGEYREYTFRYKDRFVQTYPDYQDVDPRRITDIVVFINPGKAPFTGTIYIDEVEAVFTGKVDGGEEDENAEPAPAVEDKTEPLKDDISGNIYSWWSNESAELSKDKNGLVVTSTGDETISFGRAFQTVDFEATPILKVRIKADNNCKVRADLRDSDEHTTNSSPVIVDVKKSGDYVDYYFDFTGKFEQSTPDKLKVNPKDILEVVFYINPGKSYSGKVFVDSIESIKELPK